MGNKKEYNQYLWAPEQPRVYETSPLRISGTPMSEEDVAMSLKAENLQQSLQQNPIFKSAKQRVAQQKQREKEIAASKKWLELHPEDDNDDPYTIFERGKHQAIVNGKDPSYYEKMINDGKQFTKGALTILSLPYLGAAAAGAYGYGASLGARELFAGQGIYGLANKDGVRKTVNLIKSGNYGRAALSGAGDALNATMVFPGAKFLGSAAKYGLKSTVTGDILKQNIRNATLVTSKPLLNVGWGPRQTLKVSRAGEYDQMYFPERWDVVNEGANPHGVWLQGKYGTPRTDLTNPGKGAKAARARNVFSTRSDKYTGTVTLDKPMVTVGEVPNRSSLSYQADNIGADGLIYNGVYDNGYNNNQVILSFRRPELTKIQLSEAERLGIPKGTRNQPDNTALPTRGFDVIPTNKNNFYRVSGPSEITDISEFGKLRIDPIARFDQMQLRIINEQTGIPMERLYEINASDNPRAIQNLVIESEAYKSASPFDQFNMKLSAARPKSNHGDKGFQRGAFFSIYDPNNPASKYYGAPTIVGTTRKSSFLGGHHGDYRGEWNLDIPVGSGQNSGSAVLRNGFEKENFKYWKLGNDGKWYLHNFKQGGILKRVESGKSGIHIKPENRGKFTALKKRTGKSSTWYKEHGTPAQKKMAVFALNARKWKHK